MSEKRENILLISMVLIILALLSQIQIIRDRNRELTNINDEIIEQMELSVTLSEINVLLDNLTAVENRQSFRKFKSFLEYPLYVSQAIPREYNDSTGYQRLLNIQKPIFTIEPFGSLIIEDEHQTRYMIYYWDEEALLPVLNDETELNATFSFTVEKQAFALNLTDEYPLDKSLLPDKFMKYLDETSMYDISSQIVQDTASIIRRNSTSIHEISNNLVNYFEENISYYGGPGMDSPASIVLERGAGVCNIQATASVAIYRSLGIPARTIHIEYLCPHTRIQVYYPSVGWVSIDPTWHTCEPPQYSVIMDVWERGEEYMNSWGGYESLIDHETDDRMNTIDLDEEHSFSCSPDISEIADGEIRTCEFTHKWIFYLLN